MRICIHGVITSGLIRATVISTELITFAECACQSGIKLERSGVTYRWWIFPMKNFLGLATDVWNNSEREIFTADLYFISSQESNTNTVTLKTLKSITRWNHAALPKLMKWEHSPSLNAFYRFHWRLRWASFLQMKLFIECQTWWSKRCQTITFHSHIQ